MVKVGIIGSGFGLYGLLPAFQSTPGCQVVSICGKRSDRLLKYCKSINLKNIYSDWQEMLDKEKLDALAIAVPPSEQYKIAKVAIKENLHIFAEKPLTANIKQAKELLTLAKKNKVIHMIDFEFLEINQWKEVKKLLDKKKYGKLTRIDLKWDFLSYDIKNKKSSWKTDVALGGGALSFYFSHCLHYLEYFVGKITNFKGSLTYSKESINGAEVGIDLILEFENNVTGNAHLSCNNKKINRHQLIFSCEHGTIILENKDKITDNFKIKVLKDGKAKNIATKRDKVNIDEDERVRVVQKLTTRFIEAISHEKRVTPSFEEGVRVQELVEKIRTSSNG